jgi:hypothetical protein
MKFEGIGRLVEDHDGTFSVDEFIDPLLTASSRHRAFQKK